MKNYDPNIYWGRHTIKVSFQCWDYKGYVTYRVGGNAKGISVLQIDHYELSDTKFLDNNVRLRDSGEGWYRMYLTNGEGEELEVEEEWTEISNSIVGVQIIDFVKEDEA